MMIQNYVKLVGGWLRLLDGDTICKTDRCPFSRGSRSVVFLGIAPIERNFARKIMAINLL
jgi:hypothetical protein